MTEDSRSLFTAQKSIDKHSPEEIQPSQQTPESNQTLPPNTLEHAVTGSHTGTSGLDGSEDRGASQQWGIDRSENIRLGAQDQLSPTLNRRFVLNSDSLKDSYRQDPLTARRRPFDPPASSSLKRNREEIDEIAKGPIESPLKRPRHRTLPPSYVLDPNTFPKGFSNNTTTPPSPLFFSHNPRQGPPLSVFSSAEAAVTMLDKSRDESSGSIKTLKLARGSISNSSPPGAASSPSSWMSVPRNSTPRSPDSGVDQSDLQVLGSIGIVDLLELDERPTLILDLANPKNFSPGPLQILFANASLRSCEPIFELVVGKAGLDSPSLVDNAFPEFKAWALSFVKNQESMDVCLPSFMYGGLTWNCSTLKKRLRVISGTNSITMLPRIGSGSTFNSNGIPSNSLASKSKPAGSPLKDSSEAPDYFGDAAVNMATPGLAIENSLSTIPIPSVEFGGGMTIDRSVSSNSLSDPMIKDSLHTRPQFLSSFDWTRLPLSSALPSHIQFARSVDWGSTSLGPIDTWSFDLRAMCNLIMGSPHPAAMYWGPDLVTIYNEAYILLAGNNHPKLMGQNYKVAWAEIWDDVKHFFNNAIESGQATMKDDDCLFVRRNGYLEECYFSWSLVPLVGEDGSVVGLYNPAFEKTRRKVSERRMLTLREVGEKTGAARELSRFWGQVIKGLEYNEHDVPFVFLYSVADDGDSDMSSTHSGSHSTAPNCVLEGTLGVPAGHPTTTTPLDLRTAEYGWAPYLRESMKTNEPVLLTIEDGTLSGLISGLEFRGFGDACRAAIVCPIHPTTGESVLGFLVMGINPRRPYDDDYSLFIQLLSRQLATSMAAVVLFEEEIRRGQRAARLAALDRIELSKQLDLRTQEVAESETRFTRMAEFAPVGMFIANSEGRITYSNDTWWEITRHSPREANNMDSWMDSIKDEDRKEVQAVWSQLVINTTPVTQEFRVKAPWQGRDGNRFDTWVLMSAYPEKNAEGGLKSVFGSLTNISQQKWAEDFQKRRMEEAVELKRQQENFIDMTSHEMRNPLSAMIQCADEIMITLSAYRGRNAKSQLQINEILDNSIDAAQIISACAAHQKRIIDDGNTYFHGVWFTTDIDAVLTLSKLDSSLLQVTPVDVQPVAVVQRALKMFEGELQTNDITLDFQVQQSYTDLEVDWVKLDPSRLLQVLINLTTNAIKFTHTQDKRTITVKVGASKERPSVSGSPSADWLSGASSTGVSYFPTRFGGKVEQIGEDWGTGEEIFVHFAIQDTGRGLDEAEKKLLFLRFSQASPRTHVQYGGSGLGLFISRELTELQGGEIGVASERGVGSTFAFYVKGRRAVAPRDAPLSPNTLLRKTSSVKGSLAISENRKTISAWQSQKTAQPSPPENTAENPQANNSERSAFKVLIVEDNLVNQRVLQKQLKNLGCVTYVANHGLEALEMLEKTNFWLNHKDSAIDLSVILMDLEMPTMDGLTCTRKIREFEGAGTIVRHVPIIAVTANARMEQIETALDAGMDDVVSKPFRIPELIPKIEDLLEKYRDS